MATYDTGRVQRLSADVEMLEAHVDALRKTVAALEVDVRIFSRLLSEVHDKLGLIRADAVEGR